MSATGDEGPKDISRQNSTRRQRAPTITIDTSAVNPNDVAELNTLHPLSHRVTPLAADSDLKKEMGPELAPAFSPRDQPPTILRPANSFESRDSRPTSPHNVSSPSSKWGTKPHDFLSVPSAHSRGNSVDSEDLAQSPTSYGGDTYIPSPSSSHNGESRRLETSHSNDQFMNDGDALKADPGNEADFVVENSPFAFSPGQLNKLINPKSLGAFHALGGLAGLEKGLRTDRRSGLSVDERSLDGAVSFQEATAAGKPSSEDSSDAFPVDLTTTATTTPGDNGGHFGDRKRVYSDNLLPEKKAKSIFELAWLAYNDKVLILLSVAAVISLALGIYQSRNPPPSEVGEVHVEWVEGVAIIVAIVIVVVVGAANDWQKEKQFVKLNKKKEDRLVKVVRSGKSQEISVHDVLVGDVMHLEPGDMVPVDGIFISGHSVVCDESTATGESDLKRKREADDVFKAIDAHESVHKMDPFIISGAKVNEGMGKFLVTATGVNSSYGKTLMSLREDAQTTPLQSKLNVLAEYIAKLGLAAGLFLFVVTFIEFLVRLKDYSDPGTKGQAFLNVFIVAVTIVVVAVPEGLPLAVTLALAFATTRMLKDNNLVRLLRACETMGNATTICSDKTGTLTQNKMSVVVGAIGACWTFGDKNQVDCVPKSPLMPKEIDLPAQYKNGPAAEIVQSLDPTVKELLKSSIVANTTAFEADRDGEQTFIGSKTETAMLHFARAQLGMGVLSEERSNLEVVQAVPFDSARKCMATAVKMADGLYRLYVKGASEIMLSKCSAIIQDPSRTMAARPLAQEDIDVLNETINEYASRSLRTIGLLYKDFQSWPPRGYATQVDDPKFLDFDKAFKDMTFLGIVGIQDPLRDGVTAAVRTCQHAGVVVRMVTGDNVVTAKAIATECGIYSPGGIVMEGPQFRKLKRNQMNQMLPNLQVLARSSPEDKRILVKRLRDLGETVAVTGDGTNDAPALKIADVGFSMGISGTEVAKEASAIILMDDNFASIVKAMMWGRAVNDAVKKFLQFQVTVNITAVLLTFISAVASSNQTSVLTAVQLLWVNLIMDTFAALALATDPPAPSVLDRKPEPKSAPLITLTMWKMIVGQSIYQLIVTLVLFFAGPYIAGVGKEGALQSGASAQSGGTPGVNYELNTVVFNTFVWMQIFNQYNCRRLDNKFNIFEGMFRNYFFIGIQFIICAGQILIVFKGSNAFSVTPLTGGQWAISLVLGVISIPIAMLIRLIPDQSIRRMIPAFLTPKPAPELVVSDEDRHFEWNPALEDIKADLAFLKMVRGGRLNVLKYKLQHPREMLTRSRSGSRSRASSIPQTPTIEQQNPEFGNGSPHPPPTPDSHRSLSRRRGRSRSNSAFGPAAAMAGIVAGSIAGWSPSPLERRDGDPSFGRFQMQDRTDSDGNPGGDHHPGTRGDSLVLGSPVNFDEKPPGQKERKPSFGNTLAPPSLREDGSTSKPTTE